MIRRTTIARKNESTYRLENSNLTAGLEKGRMVTA
jgi:hypothetical protein